MEIESRKCINISKIVEYLSELTLRQSHTVTGFDTTSFLHGVGEIKVPKMSKWKRKTQASKGNWIVDDENEEVRSLWFTGMLSIPCFHFHSNQQI